MKSYLEMGLPVVMTRISEIVPYIERFKAGEVIDSLAELPQAIARIAKDSHEYAEGVRAFSEHFEFSRYYDEKFMSLAANKNGRL